MLQSFRIHAYLEHHILSHQWQHDRVARLQEPTCKVLGSQPLQQTALPFALLTQHLQRMCRS